MLVDVIGDIWNGDSMLPLLQSSLSEFGGDRAVKSNSIEPKLKNGLGFDL